ncbi:copper-binding protein [Sesbania bispinosa]|nr:copper-binding protein [Sesbania bispinosa]
MGVTHAKNPGELANLVDTVNSVEQEFRDNCASREPMECLAGPTIAPIDVNDGPLLHEIEIGPCDIVVGRESNSANEACNQVQALLPSQARKILLDKGFDNEVHPSQACAGLTTTIGEGLPNVVQVCLGPLSGGCDGLLLSEMMQGLVVIWSPIPQIKKGVQVSMR